MHGSMLVTGGEILTPKGWTKGDLLVEGDRIARVGRRLPRTELTVDAAGARVLPGLVDLQVNGAFGRSFGTASAVECAELARRLAARGTTSFLATLISQPEKSALAALQRLSEARALEPSILGVHLEGPYLNPERAGAHSAKHLRRPSLVEFTRLVTEGEGLVRMMTLAPEVDGALSLVAAAGKRNVLMAAGHTMATRAELQAASRAGLRVVTHLFNAMRPFHHRQDGVIEGALLDDTLTVALIYDRQHVSRSAAELALRCKPPERVVLVSDASPMLEAADGEYDVEGTRVVVKGGQVRVRGTDRIAGSSATLLGCVRCLVEDLGTPVERAWAAASAHPASLLGAAGRKGVLSPGADADLVVLEPDWSLRAVVAGGKIVREREGAPG